MHPNDLCYFGTDWLDVPQFHFIIQDTQQLYFLTSHRMQLELTNKCGHQIYMPLLDPPIKWPTLPSTYTSPTDQLDEDSPDDSEEALGDSEPQDGKSLICWVNWNAAAWPETSATDLIMRTKETCITLNHKMFRLFIAVAKISLM